MSALFPGQEDYAAWVGRKNNNGMGGMGADQLGWNKYQEDITGRPYQPPAAPVFNPGAPAASPIAPNAPTIFNESNSPSATPIAPAAVTPNIANNPNPNPIVQPPIAGTTTAPTATPVTAPANITAGVPDLGTDSAVRMNTQKRLAGFGGIQ
jgi:hypothetical protein